MSGPARRHSSFRHLLAAAGGVGLLMLGGNAASAQGDYIFAEGNAARLAGAKRVVITNFVVASQLDGSERKDDATKVGNTTLLGGSTKEVAARMAWKSPDATVMQELADFRSGGHSGARGLTNVSEAKIASAKGSSALRPFGFRGWPVLSCQKGLSVQQGLRRTRL